MVYNTTQHPHIPPQPHIVCITVQDVDFGKVAGVGEVIEKVDGQQFRRGAENTNMYHRERILETSTLSCNEEEEDITKPPKR